MRYTSPIALLAAISFACFAPAAGAQEQPRAHVPVPAAPKQFVPKAAPRPIANSRPAVQRPAPPSSRGGLMGVPAKLPNVLGRNRSLPIERQVTLPGLPPGSYPTGYPYPAGGVVGDGPFCDLGDGLVIRGNVDDGDWKLKFHLGDHGLDCDRHDHHHSGYYSGWYNSPWWYRGYGSWYNYNYPVDGMYYQNVDYSLRLPQLTQPEPAAPAQPERELTALETAELLMAVEQLEPAIQAYRDHLAADPEDVRAMRALGLAMIEHGRMEDGIAMVALAYRTDPMLARTPLDLAALGLDGRRFDSLLARVLGFAKRIDSGSAHLAGAMLLQADGKVSGAGRVLERGERAGLEGAIADAFRRELGRPANG